MSRGVSDRAILLQVLICIPVRLERIDDAMPRQVLLGSFHSLDSLDFFSPFAVPPSPTQPVPNLEIMRLSP